MVFSLKYGKSCFEWNKISNDNKKGKLYKLKGVAFNGEPTEKFQKEYYITAI